MAARSPSLADVLTARSEAVRTAADILIAETAAEGYDRKTALYRLQHLGAYLETALLQGFAAAGATLKSDDPPKVSVIEGGKR